jgi:hypothetical protein
MTQLAPFLSLIGVAAVALAALGAALGWYGAEGRRIRRGLRKVLGGEPHALLIAHGRGRAAGFNFTTGTMAVAWDAGAWCLLYRIEELLGMEVTIDGLVAGRTFRGEPRRPMDVSGGAERQVSLRLVFDDPQHVDFVLELWHAERPGRPPAFDAGEAVEEGARWLARLESLFRRKPSPIAARAPEARPPEARPQEPRPQEAQAREPLPREPQPLERAAAPEPAAGQPHAPYAAAPSPARQELPFDEAAPWDADEDEDDERALL